MHVAPDAQTPIAVQPSDGGLKDHQSVDWRTGGFVYVYDDRRLDCFFRVSKE